MKVLRQAEIARRLSCSRWTVRRIAETDATFPAEREISSGIRGILEDEFDAWLRSRAPVSRAQVSRGQRASGAQS
jgi:predicted DNA-binding transcriptional regulator AlpA